MKNLLAAVFALALAGGAVADNVANEWIGVGKVHGAGAGVNTYGQTQSTTLYYDARYGIKTYNPQSNTVLVDGLRTASYGSTEFTLTAVQLLDQRFVVPFTLFGMAHDRVHTIKISARDGSSTNFLYVGFSQSLSGHGAAAAAFFGRTILVGGAPGAIYQPRQTFEVRNLSSVANFGTVYASTSDVLAQGVIRITCEVWAE